MRKDIPCKYKVKKSWYNYITIRQKRIKGKKSLKENIFRIKVDTISNMVAINNITSKYIKQNFKIPTELFGIFL